jgi:hypothetical protein
LTIFFYAAVSGVESQYFNACSYARALKVADYAVPEITLYYLKKVKSKFDCTSMVKK